MLSAAIGALPSPWITRFAPSPTGVLHLGHVVNAACVWGLARAFGGRVVLRLEDHDRSRCRPEYERALLDDLDWLGLVPDEGTTDVFRRGATPLRQSDAAPRYEAALAALERGGLVYPCDCSRKDIAREAPVAPGEEPRHPGRCRERRVDSASTAARRVRMDPGLECFDDLRLGPQAQDPDAQCGDLLVRDRLGQWTYQFAVVVDDIAQGVDLVVRGEDLLDSTGRQIRLARLLGRDVAPRFFHHPLIRKPTGEKLSKAAGDAGLRELRAAGASAAEVLGRAAWLVGLQPEPRAVPAGELARLFA